MNGISAQAWFFLRPCLDQYASTFTATSSTARASPMPRRPIASRAGACRAEFLAQRQRIRQGSTIAMAAEHDDGREVERAGGVEARRVLGAVQDHDLGIVRHLLEAGANRLGM